MTQPTIESLTTANNALTKQLEQAKANFQGIQIQLQATQEMLNEGVQTSLQLRTKSLMMQKVIQEQTAKAQELTKQVADLSAPKKVEAPVNEAPTTA